MSVLSPYVAVAASTPKLHLVRVDGPQEVAVRSYAFVRGALEVVKNKSFIYPFGNISVFTYELISYSNICFYI